MRHASTLLPLLWCVALTGLAGCEDESERAPLVSPSAVPAPGDEGFDAAFLQATGESLTKGHEVEVVLDGDVFDAMERLISGAKSSIHVVVFIWRPGEASDRILAAMAARAQEGVACRVVVDPVGSTDTFDEEVRPRLEEMGCDVRRFRPMLDQAQIDSAAARTHRKLVVVDGEVGLTGGFGIHDAWLGDGVSSKEQWRDTNVLVRGPAVQQMQLAFADNWQEAGGGLLPADALEEPRRRGKVKAAFSASEATIGATSADRLTQLLIGAAQKRLWISNAYFVPNEGILQLLEERRRAGVDVRLLVAGPVHDWKPILAAQRAAYDRLLRAGVRIYEWQPSMMHAKTMLVDDRVTLIGSTNMDPLSLNRLEEGSLVMDDSRLARRMETIFLDDLRHTKEMKADDVPGLSAYQSLSREVTRIIGRW